jgi:hypothetical protein
MVERLFYNGQLADWLGTGLQTLLGWFDSNTALRRAVFVFPCYLLERKYLMAKKEYGTRKKYHFIYKTTNLLSGRYYIGMHSTDNLNDGYLGSGTYLRRSINKHGKENHSIEILEFVNSREELAAREKEIVSLQEIAKKECMNLKVGGEGGFVSKEACRKGARMLAKLHKERCKNDPEYRKKRVEISKKTAREQLEKGTHPFLKVENRKNWKGKKHRPETIEKMKESHKGAGKGDKNSQYGTCWITNEVENKKICKGELIPEGWKLGRKIKKN